MNCSLLKEKVSDKTMYSLEIKKLIQRLNWSDKNLNISEYVTFYIGHENYGIKKEMVHDIIHLSNIKNVPGRGDYAKGFINHGDCAIPLFDMGLKFTGDDEVHHDPNVIIVIQVNGSLVGMIAKRVSDVIGMY